MSFININRNPDIVLLQSEYKWVKISDNRESRYFFKDVEIETESTSSGMNIRLLASSTPVKRVVLRWKESIEADSKILGDHWERGYGDLEWRGIVPERIMPWYFLTNKNSITNGYGVKTAPKAMCFWQVNENYITLCLDVRCGGSGVILNGRLLEAATVVSREGVQGESSFAAAKKFCSMLCEKPLMPAKPVYGGNNWYYAYGKSSHEDIIEDSKLISELSDSADNRPFMVIDDGWQLCHSGSFNGGPWKYGNYLFPDMQKLASQMKEIGTKPGIWIRPLLTSEKVHESWILPNSRFRDNSAGIYMDPSVPEVLNKISEDLKSIVSWGYELIKHDFSTYDIFGRWGMQMDGRITNDGWSFKDTSKTSAEIILDFYKTIRKAVGETIVIGCNTVSHLSAGIFEVQRTGDDTSGVEWERTRKMGINTLAFRMQQHGSFYAVDADCVGLTNNIPWELNKQWLYLLAKSGTPLFVSADQKAMGAEQKKAVRAAFDTASKVNSAAEPLDWLNTTCPEKWLIDGKEETFDWTDICGM